MMNSQVFVLLKDGQLMRLNEEVKKKQLLSSQYTLSVTLGQRFF